MLELIDGTPRPIVQRCITRAFDVALRTEDERLASALAETVVEQEVEDSYPALAALLRAKISDELYNYLAVLLAGTGRPSLLAILERELRRGHRPTVIAEALAIRPTPPSLAILKRWEDGEPYDDAAEAR